MQTSTVMFTIGTLAHAAGVNLETIRFYQRRRLMVLTVRPPGGIRRYGEKDLARVRFIKSSQSLGFSLDEVAELLKLEDGTHCDEARDLGQRKLANVQEKLVELARIEAVLGALVARCGSVRGDVTCPLISALHA